MPTPQPTPQPDPPEPDTEVAGTAEPAPRPGLYVVDTSVDTTLTSVDAATSAGTAEKSSGLPAEASTTTADEQTVTPLVPWDQRVLDSVERVLAARPGWTTTPPSYAQTWAYSRRGDWTTGEGGLLRAAHSALVLAAVAVLFPLDWILNVVRDKPIGLVLVAAVVVLLALAY